MTFPKIITDVINITRVQKTPLNPMVNTFIAPAQSIISNLLTTRFPFCRTAQETPFPARQKFHAVILLVKISPLVIIGDKAELR